MFDTHIPIPARHRKYHFEKMMVGDSLEVETHGRYRQTLSRLVSDYGKKHNMKFTVRKVSENSVRVWRIE